MPPKFFDEEKLDAIINCVKNNPGRTAKTCAAKHGMSGATFDSYMRNSVTENPEDYCKDFAERMSEAMGFAQAALIDRIAESSLDDWKAADRLLQVMNPVEFAPTSKLHQTVETTGTVEVKHSVSLELDMGDLDAILGVLRRNDVPKALVGGGGALLASSGDWIDVEIVDAEVLELEAVDVASGD